MIWEYKESTEILRTYHKKDIDSEPDPAARENIITYSYMLDDDVFGSTPTPEEDTSYYFNHSCAPNCWYQVRLYSGRRRYHHVVPSPVSLTVVLHHIRRNQIG